MRIVLDTNVLIAAFISRGVCSQLLEHCGEYHQLITSEFILGELQEKLVRKFKFAPASIDAVRELLESIMIVVTPQKLDTPVCRDPDDDIILGTALAGEAVCIVTGDKDLLTIQVFRNIDLVAPSAFSDYEAAKTEPDASA